MILILHEYILELNIAMHDALHVYMLNCPTELAEEGFEFILLVAQIIILEIVVEGKRVIFHHHISLVVNVKSIEIANDIRVF
jgi:hypothetical protein